MEQPKGHGLLIEPLAPTDYVAGDGKLSGEVINESGDWSDYIIDEEHQAPNFETNACASFGTVDAAQALRKHFDSTEQNLSDRFLAKISNTDPANGNTPARVAQAFRDNWACLEQLWPMEGVATVQDYYKPLTKEVINDALTPMIYLAWVGADAASNNRDMYLQRARLSFRVNPNLSEIVP